MFPGEKAKNMFRDMSRCTQAERFNHLLKMYRLSGKGVGVKARASVRNSANGEVLPWERLLRESRADLPMKGSD